MATKTTVETIKVAEKYRDLSTDTQLFIERYGAPDEDFGWKDELSPTKKSRTLQWTKALPVVVEITDSVDVDDVLGLPEIRYHEKPDGSWKILNSVEKMMSKLVELGVKPKDPSRFSWKTPVQWLTLPFRWTRSKMPSPRTISTVIGCILLAAVIVVVVGYAVSNGIAYFKATPEKTDAGATAATEPEKKDESKTDAPVADLGPPEEPATEEKPPTLVPPVQSTASVVDTVKADVRKQVQLSLNEATKLYDAAKADFNAATAKFNRLSAMKVELGKDWCNEAQLLEAKAKADAATLNMNGLTNQIYVLQDQLENGGTAVMTVSMIQGIDATLQQRMAAFETRMEAKLDKTSGELKAEMKSVKETVNTMKSEVLEKIAGLEKSIGSNLSKMLTALTSIPGLIEEDLKDISSVVDTVKKEVEKHKNDSAKLAAIELMLKEVLEKLSKPAPTPVVEKTEPVKQAPVKQAPVPAPMIQGAYAPNCQPGYHQCSVPQYRYSMPQPVYGYRK